MRVRSRKGRILASVAAVALVALSLMRPFDRLGDDYLDSAMKNALVTFAVARVLNAGISVVQATELAFAPAGVGVSVSPGEILDPLNDLIERFSWVMLVAAISLGIQQLLLNIGGSLQFSLLMAAALAVYLAVLWHPRWRRGHWQRRAFALAAIVIAVRFSMGLVLLGNEIVYRQFLEPDYQSAAAGLDVAKTRIDALDLESETRAPPPRAEGEAPGFTDRMRELWNGATDQVNPARHLEALQESAAQAIDHVITLSVVFLLQTVLLPLLFLWALYKIVSVLLGSSIRSSRPADTDGSGAAAS